MSTAAAAMPLPLPSVENNHEGVAVVKNRSAFISTGVLNGEMQMSKNVEQFVDVEVVAEFLGETRRYVLYLARTGVIRSYPLSGHLRIIRKFKISEVACDLVGRKRKIRPGTKRRKPKGHVRPAGS